MILLCKNCQEPLHGKYCSACGQKEYTDKDKDVKSIVEEALHFLTHFEGTWLTTLRTVLFKPGKLSLDYCNGIRKKYYKPISFFLVLIVIYLIFPLLQGLNMKMDYYQDLKLTGPLITRQIETKLQTQHIDRETLTEHFHHTSEKVSKIMLLLLIPLTTLLLWLLYFYKRRMTFDLFILATEINIVTMLLFFILPVLLLAIYLIGHIRFTDEDVSLEIFAILFTGWITVALRKFFSEPWLIALLKALAFVYLYSIATQIIYKFLLFEVVFALI